MSIRSLMLSHAAFNLLRVPPDEGGAGGDPPATPAADAGDQSSQDPPATPAAEAGDQSPQDPPVPDWRDREIAAKHRQNLELKRKNDERAARLAELEQENESLRAIAERRAAQAQDGEDPPEPAPRRAAAKTAPDPDAVKQEAERLVASQNYTNDCNTAFNKGKKDYGKDWEIAIDRLSKLTPPGASSGETGIDLDTMVGILATDDPARVLFEMGNNPDEYARVMALPPAKRLNEMAKMASAPQPKKRVSDAPAPVDTVGGRGANVTDELDDKLSDDEWYKRREAQKRKKWEASQGIRRSA